LTHPPLVITGLVPVIHVFLWWEEDVDGRAKPGHDDFKKR
jgi:hypothetical protein